MKKNLILLVLLIFSICINSQNLKDELLPVRTDNNHFGYINKNGDLIIEGKFIRAANFSNGIARVTIGSKPLFTQKYAYINKNGEIIIELNKNKPGTFSYNGLANIRLPSGKETFIDKTGKQLNHTFDKVAMFKEGRALIFIKDKGYGFLNDEGKIIIKPKFVYAESFNEGLAKVKINNKYGFINKKGEVVIEPIFDFANKFSEGLAQVRRNGYSGFINTSGILTLYQKPLSYPSDFKEGFTLAKFEGKHLFLNKNGIELKIKTEFDELFHFSEGLAKFKKDNKFGFVDKNGEVIIQANLDYSSVENFSDGLAIIKIETQRKGKLPFRQYGYIDKQGNVVIKPQFPSAGDFKNGLAMVRDKKTGYLLYINKKGNYIYYPKTKHNKGYN